MEILYTAEFIRRFKKLSSAVKNEALKREKLFKKDPFDPVLKTHKLKGKLKDCWAFSISHSQRIVFEFGTKDSIYFHTIGTHDIYK